MHENKSAYSPRVGFRNVQPFSRQHANRCACMVSRLPICELRFERITYFNISLILFHYLQNIAYKWFQNLQSGSKSRRTEGFKHRNIFNISSIEYLSPTKELGLRGGFETTYSLVVKICMKKEQIFEEKK